MSPETTQFMTVVIFIAVVAFLLWQQWRTGKPITVADIAKAVEIAKPLTERVRIVAEGAVLAQEQIKREGKLSNEEAYQKAFAVIRAQFPPASGVTDADILREINRAVLIASSISSQIQRNKPADTVNVPVTIVAPVTPVAPGGQMSQ